MLCDPYLSVLEAFVRRRAIQIHVYLRILTKDDPQVPSAPGDKVSVLMSVSAVQTSH